MSACGTRAMISIKRYLNREGDEGVLWQVICLLIEKIGTQAVQGDHTDYQSFARNIEHIRDSIAIAGTPETLMVTAGSAVQAMADYNRRVSRFIHRQSLELQNIVSMLTETVVKISGENTRFARTFQEIADSMERSMALEDLQRIKARLGECLKEFRDEALQ